MVSISLGSLSSRTRTIRGKRSAKPLSWRLERMMALNATSSTIFGSTSRTMPVIGCGVRQEPLRQLGDFLVGQPGIGLPDIDQIFALAHREGVIAEHVDAFAVAELRRGHDHVERCQFALQLEPPATAPAGHVRRLEIFDHQPFIATRHGLLEVLLELLRRIRAHSGRAKNPPRLGTRLLDLRLEQQAALGVHHRPR